ncbi:MAG: STT3 domain-containing protein [Candidatus Nanohaloarchaea archaeon]
MAPSDQLETLKENQYFNRILETVKENKYFLAAGLVFLTALYLRYLPAHGMKYLQALDPFMEFRLSRHLALSGNFPALDFFRYFPYATPTNTLDFGNLLTPAVLYWFGPFLFFGSFLSWGQFYPAFAGAIGVLTMYFIGKEYFNRTAGLSASFFLATVAGAMHRTSAGFFEKEPTGTIFMLLSIYFFGRAWKRDSWKAGIISGIALGFFTISWGGSKMIWLLYPIVVGLMMWINEDIRNLIKAYTPTIIIGGVTAAALNPARFWFTDSLFILNIALVGFLWSRYLVEELEILEKNQIPYYTPGMSILGVVLLALSPLYSTFLADKVMAVIRIGSQAGGGVIAGTVAENTPASLNQITGQLGAVGAGQAYVFMHGWLQVLAAKLAMPMALLANLIGPWPLAYMSMIFLGTTFTAMLLRKVDFFDKEITGINYYKLLAVVGLVWTLAFSTFFQDPVFYAAGPAILAIIGGSALLYSMDEFHDVSIAYRWYYLLPLVWIITNVLGAVSMNRLIFLSTFSASLGAGYMLSLVIKRMRSITTESAFYLGVTVSVLLVDAVVVYFLSALLPILVALAAVVALNGLGLYYISDDELEFLEQYVNRSYFRPGLIVALVIAILAVNTASGYASANQLGGSPSSAWMQNLNYMKDQTPKDSTILSWWDYGYWFESVGRRSAVADGGNLGYYSSNEKINYPLAQYLTSTNSTDMSFLKKHSVDYIVLDNTMIGKYSAVSQIAHRSNDKFNSMIPMSTSRDIRRSMSQSGNNTAVKFSRSSYFNLYTPIKLNRNTTPPSISISSAPTLEIGQNRGQIDCVLTNNGIKTFDNVSRPIQLRGLGEVCVATDPYYSMERSFYSVNSKQIPLTQAKAILVPKSISTSNLVRLYLMDGYGVPYAEKVPGGSNGYVKMWKVNGTN